MPYRKVQLLSEQFYHLYNRGNNRETLFYEPENYRFFMRKFAKYFPIGDAEVHAYCLMPNHFHLLIRLMSNVDYSTRMQHFCISFSKSINIRYARTGHLFQGRFKAKHVDSTEYLLNLSRYIHLNPRFARLVKRAEEWDFSSYRDYLAGKLPEVTRARPQETSGIYQRPAVTTEFILSHFDGSESYREFVESFAQERMSRMEDDLWK